MIAHITRSEAETTAVGRTLGQTLGPGDAVLLEGPLGAGKTAFARGLAEGLGSDPDLVSSPTFTIVQEYGGRVRIQHVDLYRLRPVEVDDLGLDEMIASGGVTAVEWAERWADRPADAVEVVIEDAGGDRRRLRLRR